MASARGVSIEVRKAGRHRATVGVPKAGMLVVQLDGRVGATRTSALAQGKHIRTSRWPLGRLSPGMRVELRIGPAVSSHPRGVATVAPTRALGPDTLETLKASRRRLRRALAAALKRVPRVRPPAPRPDRSTYVWVNGRLLCVATTAGPVVVAVVALVEPGGVPKLRLSVSQCSQWWELDWLEQRTLKRGDVVLVRRGPPVQGTTPQRRVAVNAARERCDWYTKLLARIERDLAELRDAKP